MGDDARIGDETHICNVVLRNWPRYGSGRFDHDYDGSNWVRNRVDQTAAAYPDKAAILSEIMRYDGTEHAKSRYCAEDGNIIVALEHWARENGHDL